MRRPDTLLRRAPALLSSPAVQVILPGIYAWSLSVLPVAWSRGALPLAKVVALACPLLLVAGVVIDRLSFRVGRYFALWGFVLPSGVVWLLCPSALGPLRIDSARGGLSMLGWGLFAFSIAGPVAKSGREEQPEFLSKASGRGMGWFVLGLAACVCVQFVGWTATPADRALLVRLIALVSGIGLVGAVTSTALVRSGAARPVRGTRVWTGLLLALGALAVVAYRLGWWSSLVHM